MQAVRGYFWQIIHPLQAWREGWARRSAKVEAGLCIERDCQQPILHGDRCDAHFSALQW